jgi:hypothetical protein
MPFAANVGDVAFADNEADPHSLPPLVGSAHPGRASTPNAPDARRALRTRVHGGGDEGPLQRSREQRAVDVVVGAARGEVRGGRGVSRREVRALGAHGARDPVALPLERVPHPAAHVRISLWRKGL